MAAPLEKSKREEMFRLYCEGKSIAEVGRICSVAGGTALKYYHSDKWEERREVVHKKAEEKADSETAKMLARQGKLGAMLQSAGHKRFVDKEGKPVKIRRWDTALRAIEVGSKLVRESFGEPSEITKQTIIIEYVGTNGELEEDGQNQGKCQSV